ncbi:MAG: PEGA domain-containing protein [Minicystis sp.]
MRSSILAPLAVVLASGVLLAAGPAAGQGAPPPPTAAPPPPAAPPSGAPAAPAVKPLAETLTGMAKAEYEAGRILYADKDYANAIVKFQRAHELSNDPRLLWNIAVCQKNLRRYSKMLDTIRRYRKEAAAMLTDEDRTQAAEIIKTVETFVSALKLRANEDGAEVFVDDEKVGTTPLAEPVFVDVGIRKIKLKKPGFKDFVVTREIVGGGEVSLDAQIEKEIHRGRLQVNAGDNDLIAIDGKPTGKGKWEGSLPSGGHTLRVTAQGMAAYQSEVVIQDDQLRRVDVTLNPLPRDTTKTVLWIVGGAALAAGAAVGGAFLFKPSRTAPVEGNISPGTVQLSYGGFSFGGHR